MQYSIKFPDPLYERLRAAAKTDRRSVNSLILTIVEQGLDARDATTRHGVCGCCGKRVQLVDGDLLARHDNHGASTCIGSLLTTRDSIARGSYGSTEPDVATDRGRLHRVADALGAPIDERTTP